MFNWDDLRYFLACARHGGTTRAAKTLNVNQSTVSRRIAALEEDFGLALFERGQRGSRLTQEGEMLLAKAEAMDLLAREAEMILAAQQNRPEGVVRVTTVEDIANWQIAPGLLAFRKAFPGIEIELLTSTRVLSLTNREADVALRLGNPAEPDVIARKVGGFGVGIYASPRYLEQIPREKWGDPEALDWIIVDPIPQDMPWAGWLGNLLGDRKPVLRCNHYKTQAAAVVAGLGVGLLPRPTAYFHQGLQRLPIDTRGLGQPIWLVVHKDLRQSPAVRMVMEFLEEMLNRPFRPAGTEAAPITGTGDPTGTAGAAVDMGIWLNRLRRGAHDDERD